MSTYRDELKALCLLKNKTVKDIAKKLRISPHSLYIAGTEKGVSYERLNKILNILEATEEEKKKIKLLANYGRPRSKSKKLTINNEFLNAVEMELIENNATWQNEKQVCKAVLKFVGVKAKISKN